MSLEVNRYRLVVATERAVFFLGQMTALRTPTEFLRSTKRNQPGLLEVTDAGCLGYQKHGN